MKETKFDDAVLDSSGQKLVREVVKSLPEDSLSLAWRSSLNERILQESASRRKKQRVGWLLRPAFGLAFAGAFAVLAVINLSGPRSGLHAPSATRVNAFQSGMAQVGTTQGAPLEAALIQDYRQTSALTDVVGTGLNPLESNPTSANSADGSWTEDDVESL